MHGRQQEVQRIRKSPEEHVRVPGLVLEARHDLAAVGAQVRDGVVLEARVGHLERGLQVEHAAAAPEREALAAQGADRADFHPADVAPGEVVDQRAARVAGHDESRGAGQRAVVQDVSVGEEALGPEPSQFTPKRVITDAAALQALVDVPADVLRPQ